MDTTPQEITTLVGREVYSNNGVFVGEVEDVRLNLNDVEVNGLAVAHLNPELFDGYADDARGVMIPYDWVRAVGDVILVYDIVERFRDGDEDEADVPVS